MNITRNLIEPRIGQKYRSKKVEFILIKSPPDESGGLEIGFSIRR